MEQTKEDYLLNMAMIGEIIESENDIYLIRSARNLLRNGKLEDADPDIMKTLSGE